MATKPKFGQPKEGVKMDEALEESIKQHVKTKLEAHAYPREVELMKELPRTKTGKILKQELRRLHEEKSKKGKR